MQRRRPICVGAIPSPASASWRDDPTRPCGQQGRATLLLFEDADYILISSWRAGAVALMRRSTAGRERRERRGLSRVACRCRGGAPGGIAPNNEIARELVSFHTAF